MVFQTGDPVQNFPVTFPCQAITPLVVADMDGDRNYKYFIGCESGPVYGYEKSGRPLAGWNPNVDGDLKFLQFFKYRAKAFFLGYTRDGYIKVYNRDGSISGKPIETGTRSLQPFMEDEAVGYRSLSADGTEYRLGYDGKLTTIPSPVAGITNAYLDDVIQGKPGFEKVTFDGRRVLVFARDSTRLKQITLSSKHPGEVDLIHSQGEIQFIAIVGDDRLAVYNSKGHLSKGYPVKSKGSVAIAHLTRDELPVIVGMQDARTVVAYYILE